MASKKVLMTHSEIPIVAVEYLQSLGYELIWCPQLPHPSREQMIEKLQEAGGVNAIIWTSNFTLDEPILNAAGPNLRIVAALTVGVDNIKVDLIKSRGIKVTNTPKVLNNAVAELAVMLAIAAGRRIHEGRQKILDQEWTYSPEWVLGQELTDSIIGIVGLGQIGQTVAKRLKAFEVGKILYCGHSEKKEGKELGAEFVPFDILLKESDFVIVTAPLTSETTEMFNKVAFSKMKKTAVFVNVARGKLVNQDDLIKALKNNTIFAAGLDVTTPEPLPPNHELLKLLNCVVIPHLGSSTTKTTNDMAMLAAKNIVAAFENKDLLTPV